MAKIELDCVYPHPRGRVWGAITSSEALAEWLMPNDFEPVVGHRFTFRTDPAPGFDGIVRCEVLEVTPEERLRFTWRGGPIDTVVTFTLSDATTSDAEDAPSTRFVMRQDGFKGLRAWLVSRMLASGSREIYGRRLPAMLDRIAGRRDSASAPGASCMSRRTGLWAWVASRFSGRSDERK